ncbi:MAG: hypothetical protein KY464_18505 [Gemmatimonadetes bacterium]|nr:hypothetical protein [Gemmatimonadota bacterium]
MLDPHQDPLLQAILLSEDELDALWAMREGRAAEGPGGESLRARGLVGDAGLIGPYDAALRPLIAPELVASAHLRSGVDDERRVYFISGDAGAVLGAHPTGAWFVTAFDRAHLPELLVRFLRLRAWPGPEPVDSFRLAPAADPSPAALLNLLLHLGTYSFLRVRLENSEHRVGWVDADDGILWTVVPGLDPADERDSSGHPDGVTLQAVTGSTLVQQVADAVPAWAS